MAVCRSRIWRRYRVVRRMNMRKLYAAFVNIDVERLFVYRMSEKPIKQEFSDGTIETENFLLVKNGHYTKIFGTSGTQLDTPFVYAPNIMVYYSLEEESVVRFLKEKRNEMESFVNLLSERLWESEITFSRIRDENFEKQYQS